MATISLYAGKINNMPGLIMDVKKSVTDYKSELFNLKRKSLQVNRSICNLDDAISAISTSTKSQETKISSLETLQNNSEQFIADTARIDGEVADIVNQRKNDFYNRYSYLKPENEKNVWDHICDGLKAANEWCKENWGEICNIVLAIIVAVAIVAACVATFGATAVLLAAAVGAIIGLASQLTSDVVGFLVTGEWKGSWQNYLGALLGGVVGGALSLVPGGSVAACAVDSAISTLFSESLEGITGGEKRSMSEIWLDTALSGGTAAVMGKISDKISGEICKDISKEIPALRRLSGKGSYGASFKMVITKLKNGTIKKFTMKSVRNGVADSLTGSVVEGLLAGLGVEDLMKESFMAYSKMNYFGMSPIFFPKFLVPKIVIPKITVPEITVPEITIITHIRLLPIRVY